MKKNRAKSMASITYISIALPRDSIFYVLFFPPEFFDRNRVIPHVRVKESCILWMRDLLKCNSINVWNEIPKQLICMIQSLNRLSRIYIELNGCINEKYIQMRSVGMIEITWSICIIKETISVRSAANKRITNVRGTKMNEVSDI